MSDDTLSEIAAQVWGDDDDWTAPGQHGPLADEARKSAARAYREAAAMLKSCEAVLRAEPDDDAKLDALQAKAIEAWLAAMVACNRFRSVRECAGES